MVGGSTIMRFLLRQRILHIIVPPLGLFAWFSIGLFQCQGGVARSCVTVVVGVLTHLHAFKSGDALKWLGVVLEFKGSLSSHC